MFVYFVSACAFPLSLLLYYYNNIILFCFENTTCLNSTDWFLFMHIYRLFFSLLLDIKIAVYWCIMNNNITLAFTLARSTFWYAISFFVFFYALPAFTQESTILIAKMRMITTVPIFKSLFVSHILFLFLSMHSPYLVNFWMYVYSGIFLNINSLALMVNKLLLSNI